jgi:uncharacterized protein
MKLPCQIIVWDVLPAIKAAIAADLVQYGASRQEAAQLLDTAPSAISQYLSGKRGYRIDFEGDVKASVDRLARDLLGGQVDDLALRICAICRQLREDATVCGQRDTRECISSANPSGEGGD